MQNINRINEKNSIDDIEQDCEAGIIKVKRI